MNPGVGAAWLEPLRRALLAAHTANRLPHALLIHADPGTGGEALAHWAAQLVLCRDSQHGPCGRCSDCRRFAANQHPDVALVGPLEDSRQIRIDQIRELAAELALTSHGEGYKVAILAPADALNENAANAFLKTLEEPPANTLLILVTAHPSRLPATIRSRSLRLRVPVPARAQALEWLSVQRPGADWNAALDLFNGAPFAALDGDAPALARVREETFQALGDVQRGAADPATFADRWKRGDTAAHVRAIETWLSERIRRRALAAPGSPEICGTAHLPDTDTPLNIRSLFALLDETRELAALLETPINRSIALESLLRNLRAHAQSKTGWIHG
ncbi:MAG: DNA polymerase III subunit delta' [Steroidobacteraceae bacterium]